MPWLFLIIIDRNMNYSRYDIARRLIKPGKRVLDIGCASGDFLFSIKNDFKELYGIDISQKRISKNKNQELKLIQADANKKFPFSDNYFSSIISLANIEHIDNIFNYIRECFRVLELGGYIIMETPNIAYLKYRIKLLFGRFPRTSGTSDWLKYGWDGGHIHYFAKKDLVSLLSWAGFKIEKITGAGRFANLRNWWTSLLCGDLIIKARK